MRKFIFILCAGLFSLPLISQRPLWDSRQLGLEEATHLSPHLLQMAQWINMARTQPKDFARMVFGPNVNAWPQPTENKRTVQYDWLSAKGKETKEVVIQWFPSDDFSDAVKELYDQLMNMEPLKPLRIQKAMEPALLAHLKFLAQNSSLSHTGEKGSTANQRIKAAVPQATQTGENLIMGIQAPESALISLLLDDGVPSRGHRHNLLSAQFTHVALAHHGSYYGQAFVCCFK